MSNKNKIILASVISWVISVKLFFLMSFYGEYWTMWKYSNGFIDFINQNISFFYNFILAAGISVIILSAIFAILLFYFYYTYFWVSYNKLDRSIKVGNKKHAILGSVFTFLGFGCVACGQTLLYSFLLLLGSGTAAFLSPIIGQISLIIGILFLSFGIYKNLELKNSSNICRI